MTFSKNIVGKGFIARNLLKIKKEIINSGCILYAAGISNSKIKSKFELKKEISLFKRFAKKNSKNKIIYISTADILNNLNNKSKYVQNKIKIEKIIQKKFENFIILRIPQIIGNSKNKNTLINFFYYKIKNKKKIKLYSNVKRNILDINDVLKMIKKIINNEKINKKVIILSNKYNIKPIQIVKIFEKKLNTKANFYYVKSSKQKWNLYFKRNFKYFSSANIVFSKNYLLKSINRYY
tara:strand:+ start:4455 stop:5165 length:711 start_codon:yes stop_codon:yes gene_type:complete